MADDELNADGPVNGGGGYTIGEATDGNGTDPELRAAMAELRALETQVLLARMTFARQTGLTFNSQRDMYRVLGYKDLISTADYRAKYQRGGIAGRIVDAMPNATWRGAVEIIEDESKEEYTVFEQAWADFDKRLQVQAKLARVDKLAGLSTYAVLLIGHKDGRLEMELPKASGKDAAKQIVFLTPFAGGGGVSNGAYADRALADGADATVFEYDTNPSSPRFGLPKSYQLKRVDLGNAMPRPVHWSRILHVAEGLLDDEVFGLPTLERVWNLLDDLDKVTGGGAEAFWLRANQGVHVDIDKDMKLDDAKNTIEKLKEQVEAYKHGFDRWIRTRGATVDVLGSDVANFSNPADAILTQIAGAKGIPKRVLTGSEMGELASSQDRDNWKDQINGRQTGYAGPYIVRPLVDRLIEYGYLPTPRKGADAYEVRWPHIQTLTEQEKAQGVAQWETANVSAKNAGLEPLFTNAEIRDKWYAMPPLTDEQLDELEEAKRREAELQKELQPAPPPPPPGAPPTDAPEEKDEEDDKLPERLIKAAGAYVPEPGDEELVRVLVAAIEAGNAEVVEQIVGLPSAKQQFEKLVASVKESHADVVDQLADVRHATARLAGVSRGEQIPYREYHVERIEPSIGHSEALVDLAATIRHLGDVVGHEFHGNQHTGGTGGGGIMSSLDDNDVLSGLPSTLRAESSAKTIEIVPDAKVGSRIEEYLLKHYGISKAEFDNMSGGQSSRGLVDRKAGHIISGPKTEHVVEQFAHSLDKGIKTAARAGMSEKDFTAIFTSKVAQEILGLSNPITAIIEREPVQRMFKQWGLQ